MSTNTRLHYSVPNLDQFNDTNSGESTPYSPDNFDYKTFSESWVKIYGPIAGKNYL